MSLETLRALRLARLRPPAVTLVLRDCPKPWAWLRDDPSVVWLTPRADVRSHDLRPLVGLPVTALVDDFTRRAAEVRQAVADAGGVLVGIADGERAEATESHHWAQHRPDDWRELAAPVLLADHYHFWSV